MEGEGAFRAVCHWRLKAQSGSEQGVERFPACQDLSGPVPCLTAGRVGQ